MHSVVSFDTNAEAPAKDVVGDLLARAEGGSCMYVRCRACGVDML